LTLEIAVDIGGTFTDLVGYDDEEGRIFGAKSPTTPGDLSLGIRSCLEKSGVPLSKVVSFVHGSTIAINTVIERKGAATALVVTRGTKDLYRIGRGNRPEAYHLFFERPQPIVPRHLTFEVDERLDARGQVRLPFDGEQAEKVAREIASTGVEAVAVCFLHAWSEPAHELRMGAVLKRALPGAFVTLSHEILREYGEYERISTTVLNAYVGPRVRRYLERLLSMLEGLDFRGGLLIMQSNGGVMAPEIAKEAPVAMLESGPVGGFIAAARRGAQLDRPNVIAFDMGGTTAKANLATSGEPRMAHGYHVGGYASGQPVQLPVVDAVEVGSGGGSIAEVDAASVLTVGPGSAGADPGPACYGRGGTEPTVTDANLLLGRLGPSSLLGGEMTLDVEAASRALKSRVADPLGIPLRDAALAVLKVAVLKMSLAVREVSVERGFDPRDFCLVAYGGAGPLHASAVARELHIPVIVVPNAPGQFSAAGMLVADLKHDLVRTVYRELERADLGELRGIVRELVLEGTRRLAQEGVSPEAREFRSLLEIRYRGQDFALPIEVEEAMLADGAAASIRRLFDESHERQFGYRDEERGLEIVNLRVIALGRRRRRDLLAVSPKRGAEAVALGSRPVVLALGEAPVDLPLYRREALGAGARIAGPAVVEEYGSTTLLLPGDRAGVGATGELVIEVGASAS
jgi:N-methylhydantoinase A